MTAFTRTSARAADQLRPVRITRHYTMHAEGSVLIEFGNTTVLCTASVEERVPPHKRGSGEGWVTAEYGMLPRATHSRSDREAARGSMPYSAVTQPSPLPRLCGGTRSSTEAVHSTVVLP
ncbi:MAG: hypothetical protein ACO1PM_12060, partial [Acidovorax sp.]